MRVPESRNRPPDGFMKWPIRRRSEWLDRLAAEQQYFGTPTMVRKTVERKLLLGPHDPWPTANIEIIVWCFCLGLPVSSEEWAHGEVVTGVRCPTDISWNQAAGHFEIRCVNREQLQFAETMGCEPLWTLVGTIAPDGPVIHWAMPDEENDWWLDRRIEERRRGSDRPIHDTEKPAVMHIDPVWDRTAEDAADESP